MRNSCRSWVLSHIAVGLARDYGAEPRSFGTSFAGVKGGTRQSGTIVPAQLSPGNLTHMDALAKDRTLIGVGELDLNPVAKPSRDEAMEAVRTLIAWAGDDPRREGLVDTPQRVAEAFAEWFDGYGADPDKELSRVF